MIIKIVFVRHGESEWNRKHEFTGWHDCDLTQKGAEEARKAGEILKSQGYIFDKIHTSLLKRAIHTMWILMDVMENSWLPVDKTWRLNERHYGALQGLDKKEIVRIFGEDQVHEWRRSWDKAPPPLKKEDPRHAIHDPRYNGIEVPDTESLKSCAQRTLVYWYDKIIPELKKGKKLMIVAHGNSLRGIIKVLDNMSDKEISELNIPTGVPLVYELDEKNNYKPVRHYYLGNQEEIRRKIESVVEQSRI